MISVLSLKYCDDPLHKGQLANTEMSRGLVKSARKSSQIIQEDRRTLSTPCCSMLLKWYPPSGKDEAPPSPLDETCAAPKSPLGRISPLPYTFRTSVAPDSMASPGPKTFPIIWETTKLLPFSKCPVSFPVPTCRF